MSEQRGQHQGGQGSGFGQQFGQQFEQVRQRVMDSEAVKTIQERVQTEGPELVERVKQLANEAGVRRISIQHEGRTLFEFPLAIGVVGALIAPQLAALGAVAALVTNCTITVEREAATGGGASGGTGASGGSASGSSGTAGGTSGSAPGASGGTSSQTGSPMGAGAGGSGGAGSTGTGSGSSPGGGYGASSGGAGQTGGSSGSSGSSDPPRST
ncbi:MAG TPA: DUF4342 domain-containing protein [Chloroflexota bacterium]|jgi:hypothetical protein|nr:DUF4342 domain-containing protein [Chloroflexota bacterium]